MRRVLAFALGAALALALYATAPTATAQLPLDYDLPVPGGAHFYTQANGQSGAGGTGYAVSNADGIPFWNFFQQAGGVPAVGYPVSHRFLWNGFTVQAFQKVVFQWRPEVGTVYYVNVIDEMSNRGLDPWLQTVRQTPPPADWSGDAGLPFAQVQARHLALLNANPAIAAAYNSEPDTINRNGLPMAPIQDMGGVLVLRAQRKIFQQWLVETPFARAGQVLVANGGDVGKEAGLYPQAAITPAAPASVVLSAVGGVPPGPPAPVSTTPIAATATPLVNLPPPGGTPVQFVSVMGARPGGTASVTVQTSPNAVCAIIYSAPMSGLSTAPGLTPKTADASGRVSWTWVIDIYTTPGTGTVAVTCNGVSNSANIQVSP
jgi:hypothetical protein